MEVLTPVDDEDRNEWLDKIIEIVQKQPCKCIKLSIIRANITLLFLACVNNIQLFMQIVHE